MNWRERMDVLGDKKDAIDEKALEKFNEWVSMAWLKAILHVKIVFRKGMTQKS